MGRRVSGSFGGCILVALLVATPSLAQPTQEALRTARRRFQEGVAAVDAGNYEAARIAFQQAYALKPHPAVLRNLGQAELKTGRYLEAARHLAVFLRDTTYGSPAEREVAGRSLATAEAQVGRMVIEVDVPGADVTVDGETAGRSPVTDPFYAEPGERVVRIRKDGYEPYERAVLIEAGRSMQVKITLEAAPVPTPAASFSRVTGSRAASLTDGADSIPGALGPPPPGLAPPSESKSGVRTFALAATGGLALVAASVWIGFTLKGASLDNDASDLLSRVTAMHPMTGCQTADPLCDELRDVSDRRARANTVALVGGIATGAFAAAFATILLWPRSGGAVAHSVLRPVASGDRIGLELVGDF